MNKITVVGSVNLDTTIRTENFPKPGETIHSKEVFTNGGGKGANQAIAAARSGALVNFIGAVGNDDGGKTLVDLLDQDGINTVGIAHLDSVRTGSAYVTVDYSGENSIVIYGGANQEISNEHILESAKLDIVALLITKWVDEAGHDLKPAAVKEPATLGGANEALEAGEIEEYVFLRTEKDEEKHVVKHIFKKVSSNRLIGINNHESSNREYSDHESSNQESNNPQPVQSDDTERESEKVTLNEQVGEVVSNALTKSNDSQNVLPNTGTESNATLASLGLLGMLGGLGLALGKKKED